MIEKQDTPDPGIVTTTFKTSEGQEVQIPLTPENFEIIKNIETEVPYKGEPLKVKIGESLGSHMKLEDYSRGMNEAKKLKAEAEAIIKENAELQKQLEVKKSVEHPETDLDFPTDLTIPTRDEFEMDMAGSFEKLVKINELLMKRDQARGQKEKTLADQAKENQAKQERIVAFEQEMTPVLDKHPWLDKSKEDYNPKKAAYFKSLMPLRNDKENPMSYLDIAERVNKEFDDDKNAIITAYVDEKDGKSKNKVIPGQGRAIKSVEIKTEKKGDLNEFSNRAGDLFRVENPIVGGSD